MRALLAALLTLAAPLGAAAAQTTPPSAPPPAPPFRFAPEAGKAIRALWEESVAAQAERVACLGATVEDGVVFVARVLPLASEGADSMGISAERSIARCGPPEWSGTVHTHVATYDEAGPSRRFSGQDRTVMRMWYDRWQAAGVFCVVYSERDAHCEADGVVGGLRSRPRVVR
ncbi:MAG TPA: hypothetical protein VFT84_08375 [Gemmatimonadales bacterium]|nr:hypothetical protein [Gemmatimonadales bacterium]